MSIPSAGGNCVYGLTRTASKFLCCDKLFLSIRLFPAKRRRELCCLTGTRCAEVSISVHRLVRTSSAAPTKDLSYDTSPYDPEPRSEAAERSIQIFTNASPSKALFVSVSSD